MKTQSSENLARVSGVRNIVPNDVIQSKRMWDTIPAAEKSQRSRSLARRKKSRATAAMTSANAGMYTKEWLQPRWFWR